MVKLMKNIEKKIIFLFVNNPSVKPLQSEYEIKTVIPQIAKN